VSEVAGARRQGRARLGLGFALAFGGALLSLLPPVLALDETLGLGVLFAVRGRLTPPVDVVVVSISRDAAAALDQTEELDTWRRDLHSGLVDRLAAAGASAIAFDLIFDEARDAPTDAQFADSIGSAGNVILAERTRTETLPFGTDSEGVIEQRFLPLPELKSRALASAPFVLPTVPVRVGQFWTFGRAATDTPSLPVVALQAHLLSYYEDLLRLLDAAAPGVTAGWPQTSPDVVASHSLETTMRAIRRAFQHNPGLTAGARERLARVPQPATNRAALEALVAMYAGDTSRYLNFYGPPGAVTTLPYDEVLLAEELPNLAGKMVFVGFAEPRQSEQQDDFLSVFSQQTGNNLSGVEVGATAFANLLDGKALTPLPMPLHFLLVLVLGGGLGAALVGMSTRRAALVALAGGATYFGVVYWQFTSHSVWLPLVVPLLAQVPAGFSAIVRRNYRDLALQRERVNTALGYYVPRALARRLAEQSLATSAERQLLHGTCLYTDAEHYTTVSEALRPEELVVLMNDYYRTMFGVVERYGGEISDTAGDSMVAVWASVRPDAGMRRRASEAALALLTAVDEFNARQPGRQLPTRVGLESGELLLGNVGAEQRYEYRAIGDIVNTASRIQGLNQVLGTRVLISSAALAETGLAAREIGTFLLRGKTLPVTVHEPLSPERLEDSASLAGFAAGLAAFRRGDWIEAQQSFAALLAGAGDDGPSRYYHDLAGRYRVEPPAAWRGAVNVLAK
jgi:adenylate cyclase